MGKNNDPVATVSWWPVWWMVWTLPWRCFLFFFYGLLLASKVLITVTLVTILFFSWIVLAVFVAGAFMPVAASQNTFFQWAENAGSTLIGVYNDIAVDGYNELADCFSIIGEFWNSLVAFVEAIIATIAKEFGIDLFAFTLRGQMNEFKLAEARAAAYKKLQKLEEARMQAQADAATGASSGSNRKKVPFEQSMRTRAALIIKATKLSERLLQMGLAEAQVGPHGRMPRHDVDKRINLLEIIETLCDILDIVIGFLTALVEIFEDFVLLVLGAVLDVVVTVIVNFDDAEFIEILISVLIELIIDLVDPAGCFHPLEEVPERTIACLCPHAYDSWEDVSGNVFNGIAGCVCPGIDLGGDILEDILKPCLKVPVLVALLSLIDTIMTAIGNAIDFIRGLANTLLGLIDDAFGFLDDLFDIFRAMAHDLAETEGSGIKYSNTTMDSRRGVMYDYFDVVDLDTGLIQHTFRMPAVKRSTEEIKEMQSPARRMINATELLLQYGQAMQEDIRYGLQVYHDNAEAGKEFHSTASAMWRFAKQQQKEGSVQKTIEGFNRMKSYIKDGKVKLGNTVVMDYLYQYMHKKVLARVPPARREHFVKQMADPLPEGAFEDCGEECYEDYMKSIKGVQGLLHIFFRETSRAFMRRKSEKHLGGLSRMPTMRDYMRVFEEENVDVFGTVLATVKTSLNMRRQKSKIDIVIPETEDGLPPEDPQDAYFVKRGSGGGEPQEDRYNPSSATEKLLNKVVGQMMRAKVLSRAVADPANLPDTVERIVRSHPEFSDDLLKEVEELEGHVEAVNQITEIVQLHRNSSSGVDMLGRPKPLSAEDVLKVRSIMREQAKRNKQWMLKDAMGYAWGKVNPLSQLFQSDKPISWDESTLSDAQRARLGMPSKKEEFVRNPANRVIVIGIAVAGAGAVVFIAQAAVFALASLVPVLLILVLLLVPVIFIAIPIAADGVINLAITIFNGGDAKDMDYVSTYIFALEPAIADSYTQGFGDFDIGDYLSDVGDRTGLVAQYVASSVVRQGLCVAPGGGVFNSCPPKPRYDRELKQPAVNFPEYLWEILQCEQFQACTTNLDCSGEAPCYCPAEQIYADEDVPCGVGQGFCMCWPYNNPFRRLPRIEEDIDLTPDCQALGWQVNGIMPYQTETNTEMVLNWLRSGYRSWKFVLNRLSTGVFLSWIAITAYLLSLIPFLNKFSTTIVHSTFWLNIISLGFVPISTFFLLRLEPLQHFPLIGGVFEEVVSWLRFPNWNTTYNWVDGVRKGEATAAEWLCFLANIPQLTATAVILGGVFVVLAAFTLLGGVFWIIAGLIDIVLFPVTLGVLLIQEAWASQVLMRRRIIIQNRVLGWKNNQMNIPREKRQRVRTIAGRLRAKRAHLDRMDAELKDYGSPYHQVRQQHKRSLDRALRSAQQTENERQLNQTMTRRSSTFWARLPGLIMMAKTHPIMDARTLNPYD